MDSRQKRKASAAAKGNGPASSSSTARIRLTAQQEEMFSKHFQHKLVSTPKYGMLSTFPTECFTFQTDLISYGLEPLISSFGPY